MTSYDAILLQELSSRITGVNFSLENFLSQVRHDGGVDIKDLSDEDITNLLNGKFVGDWHRPAFSFGETLASYVAQTKLGENLTKYQVVGWVFALLVISDALDKNATDLEFHFESFIDGFYAVRKEFNIDESMFIFQRFFCRRCSGPEAC